jgi:hypothetical protein
VPRSSKEKQKYDHVLSDELLNHEYASTYLDVQKAWKELQKLSELQPDVPEEKSAVKDNKVASEGHQVFDFRHIRDISNVIKYETLSEPLNAVFQEYILRSDLDCEVITGAMFPSAPDHAMPINFLLRKGDKEVAILLMHGSKIKRYSVQETEALCRENGVEVRRFFFECDNEEDYVIERIRKAFE